MRSKDITVEQLARWDVHIANDLPLKEAAPVIDDALREVLYASCWLQEAMAELKMNEFAIMSAQQTLGIKSFGADPWQVAQLILKTFQDLAFKSLN